MSVGRLEIGLILYLVRTLGYLRRIRHWTMREKGLRWCQERRERGLINTTKYLTHNPILYHRWIIWITKRDYCTDTWNNTPTYIVSNWVKVPTKQRVTYLYCSKQLGKEYCLYTHRWSNPEQYPAQRIFVLNSVLKDMFTKWLFGKNLLWSLLHFLRPTPFKTPIPSSIPIYTQVHFGSGSD